MKKIEMFAMVKNEDDFISTFLDHHLPIFDEVTVIDNGSTDGTLDILRGYGSRIKLFNYDGPFDKKGQVCSRFMSESSADILFPLDADELVVYDDGAEVSKDPEKTRAHLQSLPTPELGCKFKIRRNLQKHPDSDGWWCETKLSKMFFTKNGFRSTDVGNHNGHVESEEPPVPVDISFLDHRYHSFEYWERRTVEKLKERFGEKWNDMNLLVSYRGFSGHAAWEYASYLGMRRCIQCNSIKESKEFGLGRWVCKSCRPNMKDDSDDGKGIWHRVRKDTEIRL